jgi:hypothetical protein
MAFDGSYPAPPGNKHHSIIDRSIAGAYTAITPGTPPTGGVVVNASEFGLQQIEWAQTLGSDDGTYDAVVLMNPLSANKPSPSIRLQLVVAATGAQATGTIAAGRSMRILAIGY